MKLTQFQLIREIGEIEGISLESHKSHGQVEVFIHIRGKKIPIIRDFNSEIMDHHITRIGICAVIENEFSK